MAPRSLSSPMPHLPFSQRRSAHLGLARLYFTQGDLEDADTAVESLQPEMDWTM